MKRQCSAQVVCPREDAATSIFEKLLPEILTLIIGQIDAVGLWRFCACSRKARWFILTHHDIFAAIHETFVTTPSVTTTLEPDSLWGYGEYTSNKYTIKHHFAVWYVLKYRAMTAGRDFSSRPDVIAFNMIALSVHRAFYVATHQLTDICLLHDLCEIDYTNYTRRQLPDAERLDPLTFRLPRVYYNRALIKKYPDVGTCCILVDYNMLSGVVMSIEYIKIPSDVQYFALQQEALGARNIVDIRTVVVSRAITSIVGSGMSIEDVRREIEKVFVSAVYHNRIKREVVPSIEKKLRQFYDCHINEVATGEQRYSSLTDSSMDDSDDDDSDTISV